MPAARVRVPGGAPLSQLQQREKDDSDSWNPTKHNQENLYSRFTLFGSYFAWASDSQGTAQLSLRNVAATSDSAQFVLAWRSEESVESKARSSQAVAKAQIQRRRQQQQNVLQRRKTMECIVWRNRVW